MSADFAAMDSSPLYQDLPPLTLEARLEKLERKLLNIPAEDQTAQRVTKLLINELKKKIRTRDAAEEAKHARQANAVRARTDGLPGVSDPPRTERISENPLERMSEHAGPIGERGRAGRGSLAGDSRVEEAPSAKSLENNVALVESNIRKADHQAMFFLALLISILAFLLTHNASVGIFKGWNWSIADAFGLLSISAIAISVGMMLSVLYPELTHSSAELAQMCARKYRNLRYGFWIGIASAVISLLFLILSRKPRTPVHF
jgi:hypothetical protein